VGVTSILVTSAFLVKRESRNAKMGGFVKIAYRVYRASLIPTTDIVEAGELEGPKYRRHIHGVLLNDGERQRF